MSLTPSTVRGYDRGAPDDAALREATFGLGCFWGPDARFGAIDGVVRTRVGYAGGTKRDPSYHDLGDHTEVVQVAVDPEECSYRDLLDVAFRNHDPRRQPSTRQYQNVVLAATADQRETLSSYLADRGLDAEAIETRVERLSRFYPAEAYHQKHELRADRRLLRAFEAADYDDAAIRESPAAAKLNGYAAGHDVAETHDVVAALERSATR